MSDPSPTEPTDAEPAADPVIETSAATATEAACDAFTVADSAAAESAVAEPAVAEPAVAATTVAGTTVTGDDAPSIVAVLVNEGANLEADGDAPSVFETCLRSIADQTYPNLSILVIDAGDGEPITELVASIAPDAFLHRIQGRPGFAAAANQALTLVKDATFLLICRDDVALEPKTVTAMVEEMFRSNAGVVAPKLVEWDDPRRLLSVGKGADQFGVAVDLVEPREFDQQQHDGVRDVFVAPAGAQLVRRDLFTALEGLDPAMGSEHDDVDFSWRAQIAGARIVVSPATKVRRVVPEPDPHPTRLLRNRLRSLLVTGSRWTLVRTLPFALLQLLLETIAAFVSGKRTRAARIVGVPAAMLSELPDIRARRAVLDDARQVPDHEVRALQVGGSALVNEFVRSRFGAGQDRLADLVGSSDDDDDGLTAQRVAALGGLLLILLGLFGSRGLIGDGVVPVGQTPVLPGGRELLGEWWSGWRSAGTGTEAAAPLAFFVLGVVRLFFFWGTGVLDTLLTLGPLVLGVVGAWRLAQPLGSPRASIAAAFAYGCNPLPLSIIGAGRWTVLVLWAVAPFLLLGALRLADVDPYRSPHPLSVRLLRFGLLVTAAATFSPMVVVMAAAILLALVVASVLIARPDGARSLLFGVPVAMLLPAALHLPFTGEVFSGSTWQWLVGPGSADATFDSMADLLRFAPGLDGPGVLVLGTLLIVVVALVVARRHRFDSAARGLTVAVVAWLAAWTDRRDLLPFDLPGADAWLCLAAAGLALGVAAGVRAIELDNERFGRTRALVQQGLVVFGLVLLVLLGFRSSLDGRWGMVSQSHLGFAELLLAAEPAPTRVLWIGAPEVLPIDGATSAGGIHFGITEGDDLDIVNRYAPAASEATLEVGDRLDLVVDGQTNQLGRLVAAYGIDLVIVVPTLAPPPYDGPIYPAGAGVESVLGRQIDLQRVTGTLGLRVYRNTVSAGPAFTAAERPPDTIGEQLAADISGRERAALSAERTGRWDAVAVESELAGGSDPSFVLIDGSGWQAASDGVTIASSSDRVVELRGSADAGQPAISYVTSTLSRFAMLLQLLVIVGGILVAQPDRERSTLEVDA